MESQATPVVSSLFLYRLTITRRPLLQNKVLTSIKLFKSRTALLDQAARAALRDIDRFQEFSMPTEILPPNGA